MKCGSVILQPRRRHSMGPGYKCLHILFHHDLNTQDSKKRQDNTKSKATHNHAKGILTAPMLQSSLTARLKLLVDLPCLLDFLGRLLEGAGDSLVGGPSILVFFVPDHLIQLTLCPRREWFMIRIAEGNSEFLQKFSRSAHHCR